MYCSGKSSIFTVSSLFLIFMTLEIARRAQTKVRNYDVEHKSQLDYQFPPSVKRGRKQLHYFNQSELVGCFDTLHSLKMHKYLNLGMENNTSAALHLAFIGDSRIRQIFVRLVQSLPGYDRVDHPYMGKNIQRRVFHINFYMFSKVNHVVLSYYTYELTLVPDEKYSVKTLLKTWIANKNFTYLDDGKLRVERPDFILLGMTTHHMLRKNLANHTTYIMGLEQMKPLMRQLSKTSQVFWLKQYLSLDATPRFKDDVNAQKIHQYNIRTDHVLRGSGVRVLDYTNFVSEEYIRSCSVNERYDLDSYFNCLDAVHPGATAMHFIVQLFLNEICKL